MMIMYSIDEIKRLQLDNDFYESEGERYCLVSLYGKDLTSKDVENQANFCVLQIIRALKKNFLSGEEANSLINKVDALEFSEDLLGPSQVIGKLNKEIVEEGLHTPHFNSLCVLCEEVYDFY